MLRFIHSSFTLDLENKKVTITEENHWFTDTFVTKLSFPVQQFITREIDVAMGMVSDYNSSEIITVLKGRFYLNGREHEATMELEQLDQVAQFVFKIGFEELPNFDKKLAQLPLFKLDLANGVSMDQHAEAVLQANDPATPYTFPQIHITTLDTDSDQWSFFEGRLNARDLGVFLANEYDGAADEQQNRNILQPLPTLFHVVRTAFTDLGLTVGGDFFDVPAFAKAYIFHFSNHYRSFNSETQEIVQRLSDQATGRDAEFVSHEFTSTILEPGVYLLNGVLTYQKELYLSINLGTTQVYEFFRINRPRRDYNSMYVDEIITIDATTADQLTFISSGVSFFYDVNDGQDYDAIFTDLTLSQIAKTDSDGNLISTLIQPTRVDLSKCVPDITFRDLMTHLKNYLGIDIYQVGSTEFRIDLIKGLINASSIIDLSAYEVKWPRRGNRKSKKFVLKTPDSVEDSYAQQSIYIDAEGSSRYNDQLIDEDTQEIQLGLTALDIHNERGKRTAKQAGDDTSQFALVYYDGLVDQENFCREFPLDLEQTYLENLRSIYDYKINGQPFQWSFMGDAIKLENVQARSRIFAFNRVHVVEKIQRTFLKNGKVQLQLELLSIN